MPGQLSTALPLWRYLVLGSKSDCQHCTELASTSLPLLELPVQLMEKHIPVLYKKSGIFTEGLFVEVFVLEQMMCHIMRLRWFDPGSLLLLQPTWSAESGRRCFCIFPMQTSHHGNQGQGPKDPRHSACFGSIQLTHLRSRILLDLTYLL